MYTKRMFLFYFKYLCNTTLDNIFVVYFHSSEYLVPIMLFCYNNNKFDRF